MSDPTLLECIWVRWEPDIYEKKTKWHRFTLHMLCHDGVSNQSLNCGSRITRQCFDYEATVDTPNEKDCCKKCWRKAHE